MRMMILGVAAMSLGACSDSPERDRGAVPLGAGIWNAGEKGGLCVADEGRATFILYGDEGEANCMAEGRIEEVAGTDGLVFKPRGDEKCSIPLKREGSRIVFSSGGIACDYYCGSGVTLDNQSVERSDATSGAIVDPSGTAAC